MPFESARQAARRSARSGCPTRGPSRSSRPGCYRQVTERLLRAELELTLRLRAGPTEDMRRELARLDELGERSDLRRLGRGARGLRAPARVELAVVRLDLPVDDGSRRAPARSPRSRPSGGRPSAGRAREPRASRARAAATRPSGGAPRRRPSPAPTRPSREAAAACRRSASASRRSARVERSPVASPSANGEFADSASSVGSHGTTPSNARSAACFVGHRRRGRGARRRAAPRAAGRAPSASARSAAAGRSPGPRRARAGACRQRRSAARSATCGPERASSSRIASASEQTGVVVSTRQAKTSGLRRVARLGDHLVEERRRLERLRVDEEQLLLDAERERRRAAPAHSVGSRARTACTGRPAASQA